LLSIFDLVAILLTVSAVFAFLNAKLLRLPTTIGVLIMGLAAYVCRIPGDCAKLLMILRLREQRTRIPARAHEALQTQVLARIHRITH
jgi:Na+-transporting methylmalonyl-CoA/oxaloacetate decarboxylase beta subunit